MGDKYRDQNTSKLILVEGINDCYVIDNLCQKRHADLDVGFYWCGSDEQVLDAIPSFLKGAIPMEALAVVIDADNPDMKGTWEKVKNILNEEGYSPPSDPDPVGTIIAEDNKPKIGIWLMPDNNLDGMLEDFCIKLAPPAALQFAEQCRDDAVSNGHATFKKCHESKATLHTYLAWQDTPGIPLGLTIFKGSLGHNNPAAETFVDFLKRLFS